MTELLVEIDVTDDPPGPSSQLLFRRGALPRWNPLRCLAIHATSLRWRMCWRTTKIVRDPYRSV